MQMLSVVIITYNEEKNIGRCIDSVQSIADEIIILDSYSTDNTVSIAVSKGATVHYKSFEGYIEQKNKALSLASHDLVLSLDADEALSERLKASIQTVKQGADKKGYTMNRCTNYCGRFIRHGAWYPDVKLRLFDRNFVRWAGVNPHDKAVFIKTHSSGHLKGDILHYSYNTLEEHVSQNNKFSTISAEALFNKGQTAGWIKILFHPVWAFIVGYFLRLGFLDGYYGIVIAVNTAHLTFLKYIKLYQRQKAGGIKELAQPVSQISPDLLRLVKNGDMKAIARCISYIENETEGYEEFLRSLPSGHTPVTRITGPPGADKSTLVDALIKELVKNNQSVAVLCVDPFSSINPGALPGDGIRVREWYNHPEVYIRSLTNRGSPGRLHPKIIEISDLLKAAAFDHIIIETVGVGQSEMEIDALADTTVVVVVPEPGDDIQIMKAELTETGDIFVVNNGDRPDADLFIKSLRLMLADGFSLHERSVPVIKTVASGNVGIDELLDKIIVHQQTIDSSDKRFWLVAEKAYLLIQGKRMKNVDKELLKNQIKEQIAEGEFNLYKFLKDNFNK